MTSETEVGKRAVQPCEANVRAVPGLIWQCLQEARASPLPLQFSVTPSSISPVWRLSCAYRKMLPQFLNQCYSILGNCLLARVKLMALTSSIKEATSSRGSAQLVGGAANPPWRPLFPAHPALPCLSAPASIPGNFL